MKTEREIREKIDELMRKAATIGTAEDKEEILCNIDALLWVLGDQSGKAI